MGSEMCIRDRHYNAAYATDEKLKVIVVNGIIVFLVLYSNSFCVVLELLDCMLFIGIVTCDSNNFIKFSLEKSVLAYKL